MYTLYFLACPVVGCGTQGCDASGCIAADDCRDTFTPSDSGCLGKRIKRSEYNIYESSSFILIMCTLGVKMALNICATSSLCCLAIVFLLLIVCNLIGTLECD